MHNDDLIAYLEPAPNRSDPHEWRDVTGAISDIRVEPHRFVLCANLPAGLYRGRVETNPGAFDMSTAMVPMVRVPDGQRVRVGPWDLNHIDGFMAMPMARTFVNGKLKGGLWFDMPGPDEIAEGRLRADFGFEAEGGETELILELTERDRARMAWDRVRCLEIRTDDRSLCGLTPADKRHPRIYVSAGELNCLRRRLLRDPEFVARAETLKSGKFEFKGGAARDHDLASLIGIVTGDAKIGKQIRSSIVGMCRLPTWSGQPDPLLMGGDNDRGVGQRLYSAGMAWDYLGAMFTPSERRVILAKVAEYLRKMYDFSVLQRAYMGCPTTDPHSLGAWNGTAIACMAFYEDLEIARKALPFFHGLFRDSLRMFPPGGKTAWATFFPFHLVRYLAAAHTFGGVRPELQRSRFLDNLGRALLTSFETPNTQELQRGLRTGEHRYITAFLCRFHPTDGIAAIYQAFIEQERKTAGNVDLGLFDFLFGPTDPSRAAAFPIKPLFAKDIGDIIFTARGRKTVGCSLSAGLKGGREVSMKLMPHNREFAVPMAAIELSVDGSPVLVNINIGQYGLDSSLTNTMCFEDGGIITQGQYLCGNTGAENSAFIRRCLIGERLVYAHAVITKALHRKHGVQTAERIMIADYRTGVIVIADSFAGAKPIRFGTHLHCSGSVKELGAGSYRLSGGQANLISASRGGSDEERGEVFVTILNAMAGHRVVVEEPRWVPSYIYGLNLTGKEEISQARFPHYRRWRLEAAQPVASGSFLFALSPEPGAVKKQGKRLLLPDDVSVLLGASAAFRALGCTWRAEAALVQKQAGRAMLIGVRHLKRGSRMAEFAPSVDMDVAVSNGAVQGVIFSGSSKALTRIQGLRMGPWLREDQGRSHADWTATFTTA